MIAARQIAFGKAAGKVVKAKPYLEFDFTQSMWIPKDSYAYKMEVELSFSAAQLDNTRRIVFGNGSSARQYFDVRDNKFPFAWIPTPPIMEADVVHTLKMEGKTVNAVSVVLDNIHLASDFSVYSYKGLSIGSYDPSSGTNFAGRIFRVTSYDEGGDVLHDFIPSVVDGVPCLKDDVGNIVVYADAGTANPVYGELSGDEIDYTAKDYVQDGLVAMWDGIENGGYGIHNEGVGFDWVSCVGGLTIAGSSTMSFYADGVGSLNRWEFPKIPLPDSVASLTEWTIEILIDFGGIEDTGSFFRGTGYNVNYPNISRYLTNDRIIAGSNSYALTVPNSDNLASYVAFRMGVNHDVGYAVGAGEMGFFNGAPSWGALAMSEFQFADYSSDWLSRIKSTRCYSRPITNEELEYNRKIDKARFGL